MSALIAGRRSTQVLPVLPDVVLCTSERVLEGAFAAVTNGLMKLGTCSVEDLAHSPKAELQGFDLPNIPSDYELLRPLSRPRPTPGSMVEDDKENLNIPPSMQFVAQLHQACVSAFGNSEALKFEFLNESGYENKKQCILTITRPNGQTRSYTTSPEFTRKSDAKARAAAIAVELGAIDFIFHGNKDASSSKLILAPLDGSTAAKRSEVKPKEESPAPEVIRDDASKQIEDLCVEWRASRVRPRWEFFKEHKSSTSWGCVLVFELSPHCQRLYSVEPRYSSKPLARKACSEAALRGDVVDFIKFGNGQTEPAPKIVDPLNNVILESETEIERKGRLSAMSLQSFFDSLPKPFAEPLEEKPVAQLNIPGMLNTTLQLAKGSRLSLQFYFTSECGLHGSIARLERPGETRTYMVPARFAKRSDAKAAVCLQAMSQGVSKYIRSIATAVENKITPQMRRLANEQILPVLGSEYGKLRHGMHPIYNYDLDNGAFSCTMTLSLCSDPKQGETRSWSVKPEYRTKIDAKIAVVCAAGVEAIEFVRFKGQPPPPDHEPFKPYKRKNSEEQRQGGSSRFSPPASGQVRLGVPLETKEEGVARQTASGKWEYIGPPASRQSRPQSKHSSASIKPVPLAPIHGRQCGSLRKGAPSTNSTYNIPTGPRDRRATASSQFSSASHTQYRDNVQAYRTSQEYSREALAKLRPPRKSQQQRQGSSTQHTPSTHQPFADPQPAQQSQLQSAQQSSTPQAPQAIPQQQSPLPQQYAPYGGVSQPQPQHMPVQVPPYPHAPYPGGYMQPPYPYAIPQGNPYPPPASGYPYPGLPPPTYAPSYAYPAYYADPRYAQYPQYGMPAAPVTYAVSVPPGPGMQYPTIPPPPNAPAPTSPAVPSQLPTPPQSTALERPSGTHWIEIERSSIRTASYSTETDRDREKRPRSRDMSMSPDDVQVPKKHRSEPTTGKDNITVKKETSTTPPAPKLSTTPISSAKDGSSHVQQLRRYCESENLASPEFGSKQVKNELGEDVYEVWIVMGKERLELPISYTSENEGRQRVAKQVLQRLRTQAANKNVS